MTTIASEIAAKVLKTVDKGLSSGLGDQRPGRMCVEAAVCYAMGLPHGDEPPCVAPALRSLKIRLNDANWSTKQARAKGLRRLAIAQLGSENLDQAEFVKRVVLLTINKTVPGALRRAAALHPDQRHKEGLETAAVNCETATSIEATAARAAARAATRAAARADKVLSDYAESVVQILVDMKAPGCEFLELAPLS